jgi:alpha-1,6-mannosyltransferase
MTPLRIVRMANFVTASSGGLRTALRCLGEGYRAAGHDPVLIVPGDRFTDEPTDQGRVITVPGVPLPGTGGYRVMPGKRRLSRLLDRLAPDRLEISDRFTLRWTGRWAHTRGVPAVMVSHESLSGLLGVCRLPPGPRTWLADRLNAATAASYDRIVCTTRWAAEEFRRAGATNVTRVPLGVDLDRYHPGWYDRRLRRRFAADHETLIVHCSRLAPEKRSRCAVDALRALRADGVPAVLVVIGDGPLRESLERRAAGMPVHFTGFLSDPALVGALMATADVAISPGPVETFGLAALEALASGTPVVVAAESALPEVVGSAGVAVSGGGGRAFAGGVRDVLAEPAEGRRLAARARAERYGWPAAVAGFLRVHGTAEDLSGHSRLTFQERHTL